MKGTINILMYGKSDLEEGIKEELKKKQFTVNLECVENIDKLMEFTMKNNPDAIIVNFNSENIENYRLHTIMESYKDNDKPVCVLTNKNPQEFSRYNLDNCYSKYFHTIDLDYEKVASELLSKIEFSRKESFIMETL